MIQTKGVCATSRKGKDALADKVLTAIIITLSTMYRCM